MSLRRWAMERLGAGIRMNEGLRRRGMRAREASGWRTLADRTVTWVVTGGGIAIIASILGILLFIAVEVIPLVFAAEVETRSLFEIAGNRVDALVADEYGTHVATLGLDGTVRVLRLADHEVVREQSILPRASSATGAFVPRLTAVRVPPGSNTFTAATSDGRILLLPLDWQIEFVGQQRKVQPEFGAPIVFAVDPSHSPVRAYSARMSSTGETTVAAETADGKLVLLRRQRHENVFSGEVEESESRTELLDGGQNLTELLLDEQQANLYGATGDGDVLWWSLAGDPGAPRVVSLDSPVTALSLLVGSQSLVVGQASGALSIWFRTRDEEGETALTRIRDFPGHPLAIRLIAPSRRDKGFLAQDESGLLGLYYSTSHRVLWTGESPIKEATALSYSPKADGAYVAGENRVAVIEIDNPHPQVSLAVLFGRVWYEGYEQPRYVWQSSSGTDDFEPKLSLTPLLFGTLKGTFYSLLLAIPLAVFAAMYTSQFMHPSLKRKIKPTVEIMAALPSVVLGFLAGLWLAPLLERQFSAVLVMLLLLPMLTLATGGLWQFTPRSFRDRLPTGSEVITLAFVLALGAWLSVLLGRQLDAVAFSGDFQAWLLETTGETYDQRNAIVVGLAMGFAVIPIIFAIAEDAFSNVPRELISGSLALGANQWQTVTRVVLPTASPGIFSAVMIGFGRAVGETMIVLMATGNTPILDWSPFNGFRTLSANIAVEIPEAPQGGTLYRVLFLAALVLFVITFAVNSAAEIVRQRLRQRYAKL